MDIHAIRPFLRDTYGRPQAEQLIQQVIDIAGAEGSTEWFRVNFHLRSDRLVQVVFTRMQRWKTKSQVSEGLAYPTDTYWYVAHPDGWHGELSDIASFPTPRPPLPWVPRVQTV